MLNIITLLPGQTRELVFINEVDMHWHIIQEAESVLKLHVICLAQDQSDAQWKANLTVEQNGAGCRTEIYSMALLHHDQQAHLRARVIHNIGGGYSSQVIKFVLDDHTKASFQGCLKIQPDAQQTEAYQTNRNILLSRHADMLTEPQLEIYADDVKASHGATTGQLDEAALFYMQQRCVDRATASKLLLQAFFDEVLRTLTDEGVREELNQTIENIL
jgi:Fe-S cluster assembly protein SufD